MLTENLGTSTKKGSRLRKSAKENKPCERIFLLFMFPLFSSELVKRGAPRTSYRILYMPANMILNWEPYHLSSKARINLVSILVSETQSIFTYIYQGFGE